MGFFKWMLFLILVANFIFLKGGELQAKDLGPGWIVQQETLVLSKPLKKYLSKNFPGYRVPTALDRDKYGENAQFIKKGKLPPVYVLADFNGDQNQDIALILIDKDWGGRLVVFHTKAGRILGHHLLDKLDPMVAASMGIAKQAPGKVITVAGKGYPEAKGPKEVYLKNPGIDYFMFESASSVFYWKVGKYHLVWTSD